MTQQTSPEGNVDPNLRFGSMNGKTRYPSPFFDISQQYIPPTIKEVFKWVYYYATNNSFLGPALRKMAHYPITDTILEDPNLELVNQWNTILNNKLQIKTFQMETNLDLLTYGNSFVTIYYPFNRFLVCGACGEVHPWKSAKKRIKDLNIYMLCRKCGANAQAKIRDIPYKSVDNMRLVRINPEYIDIKYNDATGRHIYLYSIPDKLRRQILAGDPDILEDTPQLYLDAIKQRKKIRLSNQNLFHMKRPSIAGKDMGWGMPYIMNALKDLYMYYQLRRSQEAITQEHVVPFDIIFPQANGKFDPYVHSDLSSWKKEMELQLAKRRRDPNYKAIIPFPVGYERIGGDGKNLMLTPDLDFLAKIIIGTAGIPQEFVYGGSMQWSGSSISLRTLENEFLSHRTQSLQMTIWIVERIRLYINISPPKTIKFSDFKMADDIQKLQLMTNMAAQDKLSWDGILRDLGKDPEIERQKIQKEQEFAIELRKKMAMAEAQAQVEGQALAARKQQELDAQNAPPPTNAKLSPENEAARNKFAQGAANRLLGKTPQQQQQAIARLAQQDPDFAARVEQVLTELQGRELEESQQIPDRKALDEQNKSEDEYVKQQAAKTVQKHMGGGGGQKPAGGKSADMRKAPEQKPPRRQGGI